MVCSWYVKYVKSILNNSWSKNCFSTLNHVWNMLRNAWESKLYQFYIQITYNFDIGLLDFKPIIGLCLHSRSYISSYLPGSWGIRGFPYGEKDKTIDPNFIMSKTISLIWFWCYINCYALTWKTRTKSSVICKQNFWTKFEWNILVLVDYLIEREFQGTPKIHKAV